MHQFMRDMLPGTWNHRLIKTGSGHAPKSPVGGSGLQLLGNDDLRRFATVLRHGSQNRADGIYGQALRVKSVGESFDTTTLQILNMGLGQAPVDIIRPKFVELAVETGVTTEGNNTPTDVWCSPSSPMVALMDRPRGPEDVARKIPEAYPIGWTSARMRGQSPLLAYSPSSKRRRQVKPDVIRSPRIRFSTACSVRLSSVRRRTSKTSSLVFNERVD